MADPGTTAAGDSTKIPPRHDLDGISDPANIPQPQLRIGHYVIRREIAVGGMGTVYEAVQEQPRRRVALKLLRAGFGSRGALRRFELESQLLARLRHPGIAQVFEAGTHRQGDIDVPYYAMELIPGARSITTFADSQKLSVAQRLELFALVCDAVHHANTKGIIHRDIKPGNVLVDSGGTPKVIDFGVARAPDSELAPATLQTQADHLVGTLQYMSPEQCDLDPAELDARSDVYALGVVLYELLCGRLPYELSRANLSAATRIIREQPPDAPRAVKPELSEDIETVVLKAIHKERDRRYQTAEALAADVRNVLAGEPIDARRDSATYVIKKRVSALVAAHRISMWIVIVVLSLIVAQYIQSALYAFPATRMLFQRYVTTHIAPTNAQPPMSQVRIIAIEEGTDFEKLAAAEGLTGVRNGSDRAAIQSRRILHGRLMEKLAAAGISVFVCDIGISGPNDQEKAKGLGCAHEAALLNGIASLKQQNIGAVFAAGNSWSVGVDELPTRLCPAVARVANWGFTTAILGRDAPWSLYILVLPIAQDAQPSLALAAYAAARQPTHFSRVNQGSDRQTLRSHARIAYLKKDPSRPHQTSEPAGVPDDKVSLSQLRHIDEAESTQASVKDGWVGDFILYVPAHSSMQAAQRNYAEVFGLPAEDLALWCGGRAVLLGDNSAAGNDVVASTPDGRRYRGFVAQAIGLDAVFRSSAITMPPTVRFAGMRFDGSVVFNLLATIAGAAVGFATVRRGLLIRIAAATTLGVIVLLSGALLYRNAHFLLDPLTAMIGSGLALFGINQIGQTRRGRLV